MPRRNTVKVFNPKRQFIRYISSLAANAMVNNGEAEPIRSDNFAAGIVLGSPNRESAQGKVLEALAIEKHPLVLMGGLNRTETKPVINKHLPRLRHWFAKPIKG